MRRASATVGKRPETPAPQPLLAIRVAWAQCLRCAMLPGRQATREATPRVPCSRERSGSLAARRTGPQTIPRTWPYSAE
eukprot:2391180-Alexandrium_andersonii.AAC.1